MGKKIKWGIMGTGNIARIFARGVAMSSTGELVSVYSRTQESAEAFGEMFGVPNRYSSYDSLLSDDKIDVVYISLPHQYHAEWSIKAAAAGKHILCEKPVGLNHREAEEIIAAVKQYDVFFMEAFMYRCHPQIAALIKLIEEQTIGEIKLIEASFGFSSVLDLESRLYNKKYGGGAILDIGCYCISMMRLVAGVANGKHIEEPLEIKAIGHTGTLSGVDEYSTAILKFPGDIIGQATTAITLKQDNAVRIYGTKGRITLPSPWIQELNDEAKIFIEVGLRKEEMRFKNDKSLYALEADVVAAHLSDKQAPEMSWDDTLGNMRVLDNWLKELGLGF